MSAQAATDTEHFLSRGWRLFDPSDTIKQWAQHAAPIARATRNDPANNHWWRLERTWFVGANCLPNGPGGQLEDGPEFPRDLADAVAGFYPGLTLDKGQVSTVFAGYPRQADESDAAHRYRVKRDSAHVDGLHKGADQTRRLLEFHAYVLAIPLSQSDKDASPMVLWEGSHTIMRQALAGALAQSPPERWHELDLTDIYTAARKSVFDRCARKIVHVPFGAAYMVHRHCLHGVAPWQSPATAPRTIAYFRPEFTDRALWVSAP